MRKRRAAHDLHLHELAQFWNWLPAFRAVAETGGINEAARVLHVSPSALSRGVGLLESALRARLFHREGGLVLTARGERLLVAVRDAMRRVHEAAQPGAWTTGSLGLATTSQLGAQRLLPTLRAIRQKLPDLALHVATIRPSEVVPLLLRGQVDLIVVIGSVPPKGVVATRLPPAACHVYCGEGHTLRRAAEPSAAAVQSSPFAVPNPPSEAGVATDGWPSDRPRVVGLVADSLEPAIDAAIRGDLLVALPDELAAPLELAQKLHRLARPSLTPISLQCVHRAPVGDDDGALIAAIARHLAEPDSELVTPSR